MTNPIQQLVDTAKDFMDSTEDGLNFTQRVERRRPLSAAILAVESAEVETRWEVQRSFGEDRWETWHLSSLKEAQELLPVIVKEYPGSKVYLVKYLTYRTVEKEQ